MQRANNNGHNNNIQGQGPVTQALDDFDLSLSGIDEVTDEAEAMLLEDLEVEPINRNIFDHQDLDNTHPGARPRGDDAVVDRTNPSTGLCSSTHPTRVHRDYIAGEPSVQQHVRFGRGTCNNEHSANQFCFQLVKAHQPSYQRAKANHDRAGQRSIVKQIMDRLQAANMKFVAQDKASRRWYIVPFRSRRVYNKLAQSLRDDHSKEGRRRKRISHAKRVEQRKGNQQGEHF